MTVGRPRTVADAMLIHPTVHPADLTAGAAREAFECSPKTHLLLIAEEQALIATVARADLLGADPWQPAVERGTLSGRTVSPHLPLPVVQAAMVRLGYRRLAVTDGRGLLLGLLCLKRSMTGFCTDEGVATMRAARANPSAAAHCSLR